MGELLFPFHTYWSFYALFTVFVFGLLALDLGVFHRKAHAVSIKESLVWSFVWLLLALGFNAALYFYLLNRPGVSPEIAEQVGLEFLTGFLIEKSLALDNLFLFVVIFGYFAIPPKYQHRVLFYGIIGALIFRALFIAAGSFLMRYEAVVILFGIFLILTGVKLLFTNGQGSDLEQNRTLRFLRSWLPITSTHHGAQFWIREKGKLVFTPLFLALLLVEVSDIIFALDSVPAIFAITKEPFIVFTSNVFAILGLRSLYFLLAGVADRFYLLKYALGIVLIFVGLKMTWLNELFGGKFPIGISLAFIAVTLAGAMILSWIFPRKSAQQPAISTTLS